MDSGEKFFEVGISRHAPKIEKPEGTVDVSTQEVDREGAEEEIEARSRFILENLERSPKGTLLALEPSNIKRTEQTRTLFVDKLHELLEGRDDIEIVELGSDEETTQRLLARIESEPEKKFIISDLRGTWLIGFKEEDKNVSTTNKWKNKLGSNESLLGKVWAARKAEIPALIDELEASGIDIAPGEVSPKEFQMTPEEGVIRYLKWIQAMKKIGESHFPDRPLILEGISHNLRSDFTTLALLGDDISLTSINRVLGGELRRPFERSSFMFNENGTVKIKYRELEKEYSLEEFEKIAESMREKSRVRKTEWND